MSRNPSDASPNARREEAVTRRLGEACERLAPEARGQCLDAEQIAAYQQRSLAPEEAEQCEAHFAACSRCREALVLLAAAEDAAMADHRAAAAAAAAAKPARPRAWRLLWLVPAAAAASVGLWLMVQPFSHTLMRSPQSSAPPLVAEAPPPEQLTAPNKSLAPPSGKEGEREAAAPGKEGRSEESPAAVPPPARGGGPASALDSIAASAQANSSPDSAQASAAAKSEAAPAPIAPGASANANVAEPGEAQAAAPSPAATTESAANAAPAPPQAGVPPIRAMSRAVAPLATPQASAGAATPAPGGSDGVAGLFAPALRAFAVTLRPPSGTVSWRAGSAGRIERSVDGGRTWQAQSSPFTEDWLAGSAVSDTVCWLVGRNGAIARTTDGEHWLRVPPPPGADAVSGKLPDWSSVTAGAAATALVGSATGKFITRDAGNTWQPQP